MCIRDSIVGAGVREGQLEPGMQAPTRSKRRARILMGATAALVILILWSGDRWWAAEASDFAGDLYRPLQMTASIVHTSMAPNDRLVPVSYTHLDVYKRQVDERGYIHLTDRSKDVIKSGGEWISSVELEGVIIGHPDVLEAAVIGVPDERWDERPLACVVLKPGVKTTIDDLRAHLSERVAKWWIPERWAFLDEVPKTSVGKFDKKVLRARHAKGEIQVKYNR